VPFIAVCPYCKAGRVRAPESALGLTAPCPTCHTSFTLVDSGETLEQAQARSGPLRRPALTPATPAPVRQTRPAPVPGILVSADDSPTTVAEATDWDEPVVLPQPPAPATWVPADTSEPVRAPTLVALILGGLALIASQVPYGRVATVVAASLGLLLALACWAAARRRLLPASAAGLNAVILAVVALLPGWLGLGPWRSTAIPDDTQAVRAFGTDGLSAPAEEWIRVPQAWQLGDVRVKIASMWVGPVELTGPAGQKKWSKKQYLQLKVRVGNVGVAREIDFRGWDPNARPGESGPRLTDAAGRPRPAATVGPDWPAAVRPRPTRLTPARAAEQLLVFEPPSTATEFLRLELPGSAFGADQPVRFEIATSWMGTTPP